MSWMRVVAAVVMVSACKIADIHFIGPGVGDDASTDGVHDDASGDGSPLTNKRAYLVDTQTGIFVLARSMNGDLSFTSTSYPGQGIVSAVIDHGGKHLYVLLPTAIRDYAIQSDGTLMPFGADTPIPAGTPCMPQQLAVSPNDRTLAVGCSSNQIGLVGIDVQLGLQTLQLTTVQQATATSRLAWGQNGNCLVAIDLSSSILIPQNVHPFTFTAAAGLQPAAAVSGPTVVRAINIDPVNGFVYVAGNGQLFYWSLSGACALASVGNTSANATPNAIVFGPQSKELYVLGSEVFAFTLSLGSPVAVAGSPFLGNGNQPIMAGTVDPALPTVLYLTAPSYMGVQKTLIDPMTGAITSSTPTTSPQTAHATVLQLGP